MQTALPSSVESGSRLRVGVSPTIRIPPYPNTTLPSANHKLSCVWHTQLLQKYERLWSLLKQQLSPQASPHIRVPLPNFFPSTSDSVVCLSYVYFCYETQMYVGGGEEPEKFVGEIMLRSRYTCLMTTKGSRHFCLRDRIRGKRYPWPTPRRTMKYVNPLANCLIL